ncbi:MAG: ABC transporter ATP-binding protein/permease [Ruminococcus flavefaciens]|nr:ABC transporter ATP-binding protein/permease [Ruminococcus flavefaciens]
MVFASIIVNNNRTIKAFAYCIRLSWRVSKVYTVLQFLTRIVSGFLPVLITWNTKEIINILSVDTGAETWKREDLLLIRMGVMLLLFLLRLLATQIYTYVSKMQSERVLRFVEQELSLTAMRMKLEYFDDPKYYDMFEKVKMDVFSLSSAMYDGISAVSYMFSLCSCVYFLTGLGPVYTLLVVAATVPMAVSEYKYTRELYSWGVNHMREEREMSYIYWVATDRRFAQEIRVFGTQNYLIEKYRKVWNGYFSNKSELSKKRATLNCVLSIFPELIVVAALLVTGSRVFAGTTMIGDFTLYNGLLVQLIEYLRGMVVSFMGLVEKKLQIEHVSEFEKLVGEEKVTGGKHLCKKVDIEFRNVSFQYPGTDHYVIQDVSFRLPAGKKICIVGENGAGKSTLFKLLLRFYEPCEGQILLNGMPIEEYDLDSLRKRFSCFFQKAANYAFTIQENIRFSQIDKVGKEAAESEKRAEEMAGVSAMLDLMHQGRNTFLTRAFSDDGVELSGGQNQKIALARMFYKDASVLILDEPSADLDPKAEYELFQAIQKECKGQSVFYVSHRLANVDLADEIIVMAGGQICGMGTHEELMKNCQIYERLYHYQADKYVTEEK